jgi:hypothetical protein
MQQNIIRCATGVLVYSTGAYASYSDTVCTGIESSAQCNATGVTPNSRSRLSTRVEMGLEFSVSGINKKCVMPPNEKVTRPQSLGQSIISCTQVSYQHAKDYYSTRVNPVVYSAAWPIVQFTMASTSIFTGTLCGFLEWNEHNKC